MTSGSHSLSKQYVYTFQGIFSTELSKLMILMENRIATKNSVFTHFIPR